MAKRVIFIPGLFGSSFEVREANQTVSTIWLDVSCLRSGNCLEWMRLADDGVTPRWPNTTPRFEAAGLLDGVYPKLLGAFRYPEWSMLPMPVDWRLQIRILGRAALRFVQRNVNEDEFYVVAHSQGGLVARALWKELTAIGEGARLKHIVTLGSPHWGSFEAARTAVRTGAMYSAIYKALAFGKFSDQRTFNEDRLDRVCWSWPALYDFLPALQEPDAPTYDPNRQNLYSAAQYSFNERISQTKLQFAANTSWPYLVTAIPPQSVLTTVVGVGALTPWKMAEATGVLDDRSFSFNEQGDGTVTQTSAQLDARPRLRVRASHVALVRHPEVLAVLPGLLTDPIQASVDLFNISVFD